MLLYETNIQMKYLSYFISLYLIPKIGVSTVTTRAVNPHFSTLLIKLRHSFLSLATYN